jgi:hypothetical protein
MSGGRAADGGQVLMGCWSSNRLLSPYPTASDIRPLAPTQLVMWLWVGPAQGPRLCDVIPSSLHNCT